MRDGFISGLAQTGFHKKRNNRRRSGFRRLAACIVALVLLAGCLAGCQEKSLLDPKKPVQITVWHYYNSSQMEAFDAMVREFNQTVGKEIGVQVESYSQGGVNDLARLVLDMAEGSAGGGNLPDIFAAYPDTAYEVQAQGLTADLSQYLSKEEIAEYVPSFWEEGMLPPDDVATILPMAKSTELLHMNEIAWQEFMTASGGAVTDKNLETWEGILDAARLYYEYTDNQTPDVEGDGKALFGIDSLANYVLVTMQQQGVRFLDNHDGVGVMNLDDAALRRTFELYYDAIVRGWFAQAGRYRSDDVKTGAIMGYVGSSTGSMYFPTVITYEDGSQQEAALGAYPMPTFADGVPVIVQQGAGMVVTQSEAKREYAAVVFLKWLTEEEQNLRFSLDSAYLPVKNDVLHGQAMESLLAQMEASGNTGEQNAAQVFHVVLEQMETYEAIYTIPFPNVYEVRLLLDSLGDFASEGRQQAEELMAAGASYSEAVEQVLENDAYQVWRDALVAQAQEYLE